MAPSRRVGGVVGQILGVARAPEIVSNSDYVKFLGSVKFWPVSNSGLAAGPSVSNFRTCAAPAPGVKFRPGSGPRCQILAELRALRSNSCEAPRTPPRLCQVFRIVSKFRHPAGPLVSNFFQVHTQATHVTIGAGGEKLSLFLLFCSQTPPLSFYASFCKKVQRT